MKFGLSDSTIEKINSVFKKYAYIEEVIIYGSRAKGNFRNGSDIDLTIKCSQMSYRELSVIENVLDDLNLPYEIDISRFSEIENLNLIDYIQQKGIQFYTSSPTVPSK